MGSEDVIHSYYIPAFRVKADVIPGRYNSMWFTAIKPGRYHLFCAEYCGTRHSGMIGWVTAMEPRDFQAWLGGGPPTDLARRGRREAVPGSRLHHLPRAGGRGTGTVARGHFRQEREAAGRRDGVVDDAYLRESIVNPAGEGRRRLPADHADVSGAGH